MGTVTETDYGFTFQRVVTGNGTMNYKVWHYDNHGITFLIATFKN